MMEASERQLTPAEREAVAELVCEFIRLKDREAGAEEFAAWRQRVAERFPRRRDVMLGAVGQAVVETKPTEPC